MEIERDNDYIKPQQSIKANRNEYLEIITFYKII